MSINDAVAESEWSKDGRHRTGGMSVNAEIIFKECLFWSLLLKADAEK
jgi:hypothetical protein